MGPMIWLQSSESEREIAGLVEAMGSAPTCLARGAKGTVECL